MRLEKINGKDRHILLFNKNHNRNWFRNMLKKIIIIIQPMSGLLLILVCTGGMKKLVSLPPKKLILALIGYALLIISMFYKKIKREHRNVKNKIL